MIAAISIHQRHGGRFLVFRWFATDVWLEQSAPEFAETLPEAKDHVPAGYVEIPCPEDFGLATFLPPAA